MVIESNLEVLIEDVVLSGSRCRGMENENSDLDFVVLFSGQEREDVLFDILNAPGIEIDGVKIDINPIKKKNSETLTEYLVGVEKYLKVINQRRLQ